MIKLKVNVNFDANAVGAKVQGALNKAQMVLDEQVLKDSNYYIPKDTGALERSSIMATQVGSGKITWNTPYARRLYYNPQYNFSKDVNPNAQGLWYEAAKATNYAEWVRLTQAEFDKNI